MMFFVFSQPRGGIAADGEDFEVFGAGDGGYAVHQSPCRPLSAKRFGREDIFQGKDAIIPPVIGIGCMTLLDQFEAGFGGVVCDMRVHIL